MANTRPIKIAYTNDQVFPLTETDAEQLVSAMSAMGKRDDVDVTLLLPRPWGKASVTSEEIASYYDVANTFSVATQRSVYPFFRGGEKVGHALVSLGSRAYRDADLLYTRNLPSALFALRFTQKPVVYETFRPWAKQHPRLQPMLRYMMHHKRFLGVVTHSRLAGQNFLDSGLSKKRLLVAYNGFQPERMNPVMERAAAAESLGWPTDRTVVTYLGHVRMAKGLGMMLSLAEVFPDVEFVIVGSTGTGEVESRAESMANVRVLGWQSIRDIPPYLYASDILFIPPSRGPLEKVGDTVLPIKTFLYMASKRAIFGPATPDLMEILTHDHNASLAPPDDLDLASVELKRLIDSPQKRKTLGEQAVKDVADYTWDNRANKVLSFIQERL